MTGKLYLDFCGEDHTLDPGASMTFGRDGDLMVDDNPYMHRIVGRFTDHDGMWCLENLGRTIPVVLRDASGPSSANIAPGSAAALVHGEFTLGFSAGPTRYELFGALEDHEWATDLLGPDGLSGTETVDWGRVDLNDDQRLLLLAMCEPRLLDPHGDPDTPFSNRQGAARLGWSITKFNRKLDHLCEKLHRAGVPDVHGGVGANAMDRRRRLVDHALTVRLVTVEELSLIDRPDAA
jgi:hypothetical protein